MKKRVLFGIIAAVVTAALILVACKKSVGTPEDNASVSETPEDIEEKQEIRIGFSAIDMENPYFITLESAVKEVLGEEEYKLVTKDPGTDPDKQADQIQEMIED